MEVSLDWLLGENAIQFKSDSMKVDTDRTNSSTTRIVKLIAKLIINHVELTK